MAIVHSYYILNFKSEINHNLSEQDLQDAINQTSLPFNIVDNKKEKLNNDDDEYDEEWLEDEDEDEDEKLAATQINSNIIEFAELININDNLDFDVNLLVETAMTNRNNLNNQN